MCVCPQNPGEGPKTPPPPLPHRFLGILKGLLNGGDLAVTIFVDLFFCELLLHGDTNPGGDGHRGEGGWGGARGLCHPPGPPPPHSLDLRFLIGDAVTVELGGDVLGLAHPRHHLGVLLRPAEEGGHGMMWGRPPRGLGVPCVSPQPGFEGMLLPLGAGGCLDLLF